LKRHEDALRDGDQVYAVIRGLGTAGGDGLQAGPEAYRLALERAYADAEVDPASVAYLETHGSGHPAEDRLEAEALLEFFNQGDLPLAVGSLTPFAGWTGAAAGLASLARACACLRHRVLPPLPG